MAAKKAPAKKMTAPKPAPKKTGKTADSSKLTPAQQKALAASAKMRTDAAGRSGMGETAKSNISNRDSLGRSSANKTASAAARAASRAGKNPVSAYKQSMLGASYYATGGKFVPKNATLMSNNTKKKKK
jgi:hypothetical protein